MNNIQIETKLNVSKSRVWEAITNPDVMKIWFFDILNFNLSVGKEFSFFGSDYNSYFHQCKITKIEIEKILQFSWDYPNDSKGSSFVTWHIEAIDDENTQVTLTHQGLESFKDAGSEFDSKKFEMGWNVFVKTNLRNYLYNIKKLFFEIEIVSSASSVWDIMWDKKAYTTWTNPFCAGTYFTGEMELGNRIHFIAPTFDGMYSDVFNLIPNKLMSFQHIGNIKDLKELPIDAESEKWTGSFETYKLSENNKKTTLKVEADCVPEYIDYMNEKFPLALQELKKIAENK